MNRSFESTPRRLALLAVLALALAACKGDKGDIGPQGLPGAGGDIGATGPQGSAGPGGKHALSATAVEPAGANCATGGARVDFGLDADGSGVLEATEVNASLTQYLCNGAQGAQGAQGSQGQQGATGSTGATGATGATGSTGPQGTPGTLGAYGDGSALAMNITTNTDWSTSFPGGNLQFTDFFVGNGVTLTVSSGTIIRATGNVGIAGTINVLPGTTDNGQFRPPPGVAFGAATQPTQGLGITRLAASHLVRMPVYGGGAGARNATCTGGEGGGSFAIYARGAIIQSSTGSINANGADSANPASGTVGVPGGGGGGGGLIVLMGKTQVQILGALRAHGGNGSSGFDGNAGNAEGGGGGGGGGIIHLLSSQAPSISGTTSTTAGTAGTTAGASATLVSGGGGGACAGNGGAGATTATPAAGAGAAGYLIISTMPTPESLLL